MKRKLFFALFCVSIAFNVFFGIGVYRIHSIKEFIGIPEERVRFVSRMDFHDQIEAKVVDSETKLLSERIDTDRKEAQLQKDRLKSLITAEKYDASQVIEQYTMMLKTQNRIRIETLSAIFRLMTHAELEDRVHYWEAFEKWELFR